MPSDQALPRPTVSVKAVIVEHNQLLMVVKQYDDGRAYTLPGGSQEHGETLDTAIRRECAEELGATVSVERLLFVREYIGANHQYAELDQNVHIVEMWFACRLPPDYSAQLGPAPDAEQIDVAWLPLDRLTEYPVFPARLAQWLTNLDQTPVYVGDCN